METIIKKITAPILGITMFISTAAYASNPEVAGEPNKQLEITNLLKENISFPQALLQQRADEFSAEVTFSINQNGEIEINDINSKSEIVRTEVISQLKKLKTSKPALADGKTYKVVLVFRAL